MKLNKLIKERRFDKRVTEWGLRHKMISAREYQQHLKSLPDLSHQKESMQGLKEEPLQRPVENPLENEEEELAQSEAENQEDGGMGESTGYQ